MGYLHNTARAHHGDAVRDMVEDQDYTIPAMEFPRIRENSERAWMCGRLQAATRDYSDKPNDEQLEELSPSMLYSTDGSEKIEARHDILAQFLFDGVALNPIPQLDPTRLFAQEEKLILYQLTGGRCQLSHNYARNHFFRLSSV
jgi:hypothetical protein